MITVKTNISVVTASIIDKLHKLSSKDVTRQAAIDVLNLMSERIHEQGKAADGSLIGTYSVGYLKFRSQNGRGSDSKVIASFTRQLSSALNVVATEKGYGIGVAVSGRNALDNFLNKKNKAKGTASSLKIGKVKNKKGKARPLSNNDLISFLEKQKGKKIWATTTDEKAHALNVVREEVRKILNG